MGVTGFLVSLKISLYEERRLKNNKNLKCEDRRLKNSLVLKTEYLATKPEDWRFAFSSWKIWLLSLIKWEDGCWWYLPHRCSSQSIPFLFIVIFFTRIIMNFIPHRSKTAVDNTLCFTPVLQQRKNNNNTGRWLTPCWSYWYVDLDWTISLFWQ